MELVAHRHSKICKMFLVFGSFLLLMMPDLIFNKNKDFNYLFSLSYKSLFLVSIFALALWWAKSFYRAFLIVGTPYMISSMLEVAHIIVLKDVFQYESMQALVNTTRGEMGEFYGAFGVYCVPSLAILLIFIVVCVIIKKQDRSVVRRPVLLYTSFVCLAISLSLSNFAYRQTRVYLNKPGIVNGLKFCYQLRPPFNVYHKAYMSVRHAWRLHINKKIRTEARFQVLREEADRCPEVVIMVIGERMRYKNWSINGYFRDTSPNLKQVDDLISYEFNYSNANNTFASIPMIITEATPLDYGSIYSRGTIVGLFREAGYHTSWISNQNVFEYIGNKGEVDQVYELYKDHNDDSSVLQALESELNLIYGRKNFIVINLLGGHGRIPSDYIKFKPNSGSGQYRVCRENADVFINDYDNMILFQDYVLSRIIRMVDQKGVNALLAFTADHGCNLFDDGTNLFFYGSSNPTVMETHVPLLFWASSKYKKTNPEKWHNIYKNRKQVVTNNNLFCTLSDLSGIYYKTFSREKSVANDCYKTPAVRFVLAGGSVFELKVL